MSYDGHLGFGLLGDYDALPELDAIALDLKWAVASLARAAGVKPAASARKSKAARANGRVRASAKQRRRARCREQARRRLTAPLLDPSALAADPERASHRLAQQHPVGEVGGCQHRDDQRAGMAKQRAGMPQQ